MKKLLILLAVLLMLLCGCSKSTDESQEDNFTKAAFSYANDLAALSGKPGVQTSGFVNDKKRVIDGVEQLMELAQDECSIDYNMADFSYDNEAKIYKFTFFTVDSTEEGANKKMDVYMDEDGITKMTVCREE